MELNKIPYFDLSTQTKQIKNTNLQTISLANPDGIVTRRYKDFISLSMDYILLYDSLGVYSIKKAQAGANLDSIIVEQSFKLEAKEIVETVIRSQDCQYFIVYTIFSVDDLPLENGQQDFDFSEGQQGRILIFSILQNDLELKLQKLYAINFNDTPFYKEGNTHLFSFMYMSTFKVGNYTALMCKQKGERVQGKFVLFWNKDIILKDRGFASQTKEMGKRQEFDLEDTKIICMGDQRMSYFYVKLGLQ